MQPDLHWGRRTVHGGRSSTAARDPGTATCETDVNPTVNPADSCQVTNNCV